MYPNLRDFVENIANGDTAINRLIPVQTPSGDQVYQLSFSDFCDKISEMEGVPKIRLYRTIQDAINKGFLQRLNRSDVFHRKVDDVCKCWDPECDAASLFEDRVTEPFDMDAYTSEREKMEELLQRIKGIEKEVEAGRGDRSEMEGFMGAPIVFDAQLSVIDSPNSAGVVIDAIRYLRTARDMGLRGSLRGPSAFTQKTPPMQMSFADSQKECDILSKNELSELTKHQEVWYSAKELLDKFPSHNT